MTDRPTTPDGNPESDAELERRLRAAFGGAAVPEAPAAVHTEVARLAAAPAIRTRSGLAGWLSRGWVAVVLALSVIVVGSLFSGGSSPAPTVPSAPSESADASLLGPSPSAGGSAACDVPPGTVHGTWWREIGGPNAFFNWEEGPRRLEAAAWKLHVRFDPDAGPTEQVSIWADKLDSGERAVGTLNGRADPSNIYHLDSPAPDLPGGWYFFEQPLPAAGCWRLSAAIDGRVVGTAIVEVADRGLPSASPSPSIAPTPRSEPTPWPVYTMAPAVNDVLALAGRDGLPGMLYCHNMPFTFDALTAPLGAEVRVGPEFDALRSYTVGAPDRDGSIGLSFREVSRDAQNVLFLHEPSQSGVVEAGPYLAAKVTFDGTSWRYSGGGDCQPRAVAPTGYGQATWTLDPDSRVPSGETRTLHLLVQETACASGRSASGRISPAFVTWDERDLVIELFVQTLPGEQDCPGAPLTPATLRLPMPLADRTLFDAGTIGLGGAGG
jgi:hypothetical protein